VFLIHISSDLSGLPGAKSGALPYAAMKDAHEAASLHCSSAGARTASASPNISKVPGNDLVIAGF